MAQALTLDKAAWSSPWRGRSVRDKGVLAGGLLILAIALPPWPGGAACGLASLALLLGPARVGAARLARSMALPVVSILIGVATVAVSVGWPDGPRLSVTGAGLAMARDLAFRATAAVLAMFVLATTTPMVDLFGALRRAHVPAPLVEVAALVYRMTFGLLTGAGAIHAAQVSRLGYVNRRAAMRSAAMAAGAVFVRAWTRAERLESGLAGRGFEDSLAMLEPTRRRSTPFLAASIALLAGLVAVGLLVPGGVG